MQRLIIYGIVLGIFVVIINLLKYDINFKGLTYDSSIIDVISFVSCSLSGCGYVGIHPVSPIAKIILILLSVFKYLLLTEFVLYVGSFHDNLDIFQGVKNITNLETNLLNQQLN